MLVLVYVAHIYHVYVIIFTVVWLSQNFLYGSYNGYPNPVKVQLIYYKFYLTE